MNHRILIIDDEALQASNLQRALALKFPSIFVDKASTMNEIEDKIHNTFFDIAIVDLRMDGYKKNGIDFIKDISSLNPFAKIIVVSAFRKEFSMDLAEIATEPNLIGILDKEEYDLFVIKIGEKINTTLTDFETNFSSNQKALESLLFDAKNEIDTYKKGKNFEYFITMLFGQMGFNHIENRTRDKSMNEIDLILRNDIGDPFFAKFKPYILVECKNTSKDVSKNDFILFKTKLEETRGLSNLGFLVTATGFKNTAILEAMRTSDKDYKIIFINNAALNQLIKSSDLIDTMKKIIDKQVKDNNQLDD